MTALMFLLMLTSTYAASPTRIFNGTQASTGQFPSIAQFAADLNGQQLHICGGSIIGDRWILTAAHCFMEPGLEKVLEVLIGSTKLFGGTSYGVKTLFKYPGFNADSGRGDVALLELDRDIKFEDGVVEKAVLAESLPPVGICQVSESFFR